MKTFAAFSIVREQSLGKTMPMQILLTGATGFIGKSLGIELVRAGHSLTVLTRNPKSTRAELPFPAHILAWDSEDSLANIDAVFHLAGESIANGRWTKKQKAKILSSRTLTTKNLIERLRKSKASPKAFIAASAIGYYGDQSDSTLLEDSPRGEGFLADVCVAWEKEINGAKELGARVVILRFGMVLGKGGGALEPILPLFQRCLAGKLGSGRQWTSWIHREDLIRICVQALDSEKIKGVYNTVSPNPITNQEFTREIAAQMKLPAFLPAPSFALKLMLGEMSSIILASQRVSAEKILQTGFQFHFPDFTSAMKNILETSVANIHRPHHEFSAEQWFPQPITEIFPFFADAKNLEEITPPFLHFKVLEKEIKIQKGTLINYRLRIHGVPVFWRTEIARWEPGIAFTDQQLKGPYNRWIHTHTFEELAGGTLMRDRVIYKLPFGLLGDIFAHWKVAKDVKMIFQYRRVTIDKVFNRNDQ